MGNLICLGQLMCCCASATCIGCTCIPSFGSSVITRIMYGLMLLVGAVASATMLAPVFADRLSKVPFCDETSSNSLVTNSTTFNCNDTVVGYLTVYRICFAMTLFFLLMAVIMIGVENSQDCRAGIQNGFWGFKYLILTAGCVGALYIPGGSFGSTWMVFGMIGGFLFIPIQVYLIIDFAYGCAKLLMRKYEETKSMGWIVALAICTFVMYALTITGVVFLFIYSTKASGCALNKFFISINLILCVISSAVSILPSVREYRPQSGLLQSSLMSLYITYLTWSAVSNSPDQECNPGFLGLIGQDDNKDEPKLHRDSKVGLALWILAGIYSLVKTATSSENFERTSDAETPLIEGRNNCDEMYSVKYSWSFYHFIFAVATLYIMMTLTNWYNPANTLDTFSANSASMWVKIISSWLCVVIYNWWNVAPLLFPSRNFS